MYQVGVESKQSKWRTDHNGKKSLHTKKDIFDTVFEIIFEHSKKLLICITDVEIFKEKILGTQKISNQKQANY